MNFIIQGRDGLPDHSFGYELVKAINYQYDLEGTIREYVISEDTKVSSNYKDWCPVGSVEFVHDYFKRYDIPIPEPINIPEELFDFCYQRPVIYKTPNYTFNKFVKSCNLIKHHYNGFHSEVNLDFDGSDWQITDPMKIFAEWRCFVFNNNLLDIKLYSGNITNWEDFNFDFVYRCIIAYKDAPIAYTLDVALCKDLENLSETKMTIIECHNFYSCGLYGFDMPNKYPQMLSQWYCEYLRKCNNDKRD